MKTKMTAFEKLQLQKNQLKMQIRKQEEVLDSNFSYLQQNIGSMVVKAAVKGMQDSLPPGIKNLIHPFLPKEEEKPVAQLNQASPAKLESKLGKITRIIGSTLPVVADIAMPFVIGLGVKFLKKKFLKR